jgi:catechol 2,3-dioxygenase-like lactoylglutathione lyase family enzyme
LFGAPRCSIIVDDYDPAISFFVGALGSELVEDTPSMTSAGNPGAVGGRSPADAQTGILLVRADGDDQSAAVGKQAAGRAGFFLQTDDFEGTCQRMRSSSTWPGTAGICWVPRDRWI